MIYSVLEIAGNFRKIWKRILQISILFPFWHFLKTLNICEIPTNFIKLEHRNGNIYWDVFFFLYRTAPRRRRLSSRIGWKRLNLNICLGVSVRKENSPFSSICIPIALANSVFRFFKNDKIMKNCCRMNSYFQKSVPTQPKSSEICQHLNKMLVK